MASISTFEETASASDHSDNEDPTGPSSSSAGGKILNRKESRKNRLNSKLQSLKALRNKARQQNREAVQEEDRISKLPENHESRQITAQYKLDEIDRKAECAANNDDFNLVKLRDVQADHAQKKAIKKEQRKDPDKGFSSWADCTSRQYRQLSKEMEPDWKAYNLERERLGDDTFYATMNTQVEHQRKDDPNNKNRLAEAITRQQEKRAKYHRRRTFNEDDQIDYINERNRKFNLKAERAYGQFSNDTRENLERGTAI